MAFGWRSRCKRAPRSEWRWRSSLRCCRATSSASPKPPVSSRWCSSRRSGWLAGPRRHVLESQRFDSRFEPSLESPFTQFRRTMSSFGETLRRERELRGVSLREIADATNISVRFLQALEKDRLDVLPGGVFRRAFVKQYAKHLGLDAERLVAEFVYAHGEQPAREPQPRRRHPGASPRRRRPYRSRARSPPRPSRWRWPQTRWRSRRPKRWS